MPPWDTTAFWPRCMRRKSRTAESKRGGPILLTKYLLRPMLINGVGRVINISSIMADTGFSGLAVYGASKAA